MDKLLTLAPCEKDDPVINELDSTDHKIRECVHNLYKSTGIDVFNRLAPEDKHIEELGKQIPTPDICVTLVNDYLDAIHDAHDKLTGCGVCGERYYGISISHWPLTTLPSCLKVPDSLIKTIPAECHKYRT